MPKSLKILAIPLTVAAITVVVSLGLAYRASQRVPDFYRQAIATNPGTQREACDTFIANVTGLASDLHRPGHWQRLFTANQINAWLALELTNDYPALVESQLTDPRIAIHEGEATIACCYDNGGTSVVLSLTVDVYLSEPNVLALRIRRARAGTLPIPLAGVLEAISAAAGELKLRLEWRKSQGDPVALVTFGVPNDSRSSRLALESVELHEGELFVAGTAGAHRNLAGTDPPADAAPETESEKSDEAQLLIGTAPKDTRQE